MIKDGRRLILRWRLIPLGDQKFPDLRFYMNDRFLKSHVIRDGRTLDQAFADERKLAALLAAIDLLLIEAINWLIDTDDDMVGDPQTTIIEVETLRRMARENPRLFVGEA